MAALIGQRQTEQKVSVRIALEASPDFISAQDLHGRLRDQGSAIGLATVYRALNEMARVGQADVLQISSTGQLFRSCESGHHHHLVCVDCGKTVQVDAPAEEWVEKVAADEGFTLVRHVLDVFGRCRQCQELVDSTPDVTSR
ncbi:Fur family ferric uptake transcriptional regulator [Salinibacterium sp. CAN_S4]|uniref:Fur family transcriptional regulator n=1 Tax=Salinibacterium sp. CAN_S4 TaxID=2787727 RepID=UPI001A1B13F6